MLSVTLLDTGLLLGPPPELDSQAQRPRACPQPLPAPAPPRHPGAALCPHPGPWGLLAQAALAGPFFPGPSSLPFPWLGLGLGWRARPAGMGATARPFPSAARPGV